MRIVLFILISVVLFSCEKENNINVLNTNKGGSATITIRSGSGGIDSVLVKKTFTAKSLGMYKIDSQNYIIVLEDVDASGKILAQLSFICSYSLIMKRHSMEKGQIFINDGGRYAGIYTNAKNADPYITVQDAAVGNMMSVAFVYEAARANGGYYEVSGSLGAYRLPDAE